MTQKRLVNVTLAVTWTTLVGALEGALRALGEPRPTDELMGITGHAFRIGLTTADGVLAAAPAAAALDLARALPFLVNAGRKLEVITAPRADRDYPKRREKALKAIRKTIDRGRPAIAYDIHLPEYGIIYGYDDRARTLTVSSLMSGQYGATLAEDRWPVPERDHPLIVLLLGERQKIDPLRVHRDALRFAVEYAERGDPGDPTRAAHGLAAFETWRTAFEQGMPIDPSGHAHTIQVVQTARRDAARFLRAGAADLPAAAGSPLVDAAAAYERVALAFSRMATLFPYPAGGDLTSRGSRIAAIGAVREAEAQERVAVGLIAAALRAM